MEANMAWGFQPTTASDLGQRLSELRTEALAVVHGRYSGDLCAKVLDLINHAERLLVLDAFDEEAMVISRRLLDDGNPRLALEKLAHVIEPRLLKQSP
jgi:hypothetical protein